MRKVLCLICFIMLTFAGCGGGMSDRHNNAHLSISVDYNYNKTPNIKASLLKGVIINNTQPEMYFYNEMLGGSLYRFELNAYDSNGNAMNIDGNSVSWECKTPGGELKENTGDMVYFDTVVPGEHVVTATYQNEITEASVYFYKSKVLATGYIFDGEKEGIVFSSDTCTGDKDIADVYIINADFNDITFYAPGGIADLGEMNGMRFLNVNLTDFNFKQEISFHDTRDIMHTYIIKCRDGNYAKFRVNLTQHGSINEARYSIYYKYINNGSFSD